MVRGLLLGICANFNKELFRLQKLNTLILIFRISVGIWNLVYTFTRKYMHWWPGDIGWKTSSTCRKHLSFLPCYIYPIFAVEKFMYWNFRAVTTWKKNFYYANSYEWVTDVWSLFSNIEVWHFNFEPALWKSA